MGVGCCGKELGCGYVKVVVVVVVCALQLPWKQAGSWSAAAGVHAKTRYHRTSLQHLGIALLGVMLCVLVNGPCKVAAGLC